MEKRKQRLRRARKGRMLMRQKNSVRLCVNRTPRHIYAQIIDGSANHILATASTLDKEFQSKNGGNIESAVAVGDLIARRAKEVGIVKVAFDRSGFKYHGRVKALADSARKAGLEF